MIIAHHCGFEAPIDSFVSTRGTVEQPMTCQGCGEVFRVVRKDGEPRNNIEVIKPGKVPRSD